MLACFRDGIQVDTVSTCERAFLYGDGMFTTLRVQDAVPQLWSYHLARLRHAAQQLGLSVDWAALQSQAQRVFVTYADATVKIIISRGDSLANARGYLPPAQAAVSYIQVFAATPLVNPVPMTVGVLPLRMGQVMPELAGIKSLNRLEQVLLRQALADTAWDEAFVCDASAQIIEGVFSNCFIRINQVWHTPMIAASGIAGVMRAHIMAQMQLLGIPLKVDTIQLSWLLAPAQHGVDAMFFCNALTAIRPVERLFVSKHEIIPIVFDTTIVADLAVALGLA